MLYDSFEEKMAEEDKSFYGIAGPKDDGDGNRKCMIITVVGRTADLKKRVNG